MSYRMIAFLQKTFFALAIILLVILIFYLWIQLAGESAENNTLPVIHFNREPRGVFRIRILRKAPNKVPAKDSKNPTKYYENLQEHDNDSQNSHNHQVISGLARKYKRLVELSSFVQSNSQISELLKAGISLEELKIAKINECLDSRQFEREIAKDKADGQAAGVTGTPSFLIGNDKDGFTKVVGSQPYSVFKQVIDAKLG